jgi:hypothetical protein
MKQCPRRARFAALLLLLAGLVGLGLVFWGRG